MKTTSKEIQSSIPQIDRRFERFAKCEMDVAQTEREMVDSSSNKRILLLLQLLRHLLVEDVLYRKAEKDSKTEVQG